MIKRPLFAIAAGAVLLLGACSGGGATTAPSAAAPSAAAPSAAAPSAAAPSAAAPSVAASVKASAPAAGGAPCAESSATGDVSVAIEGFAFTPAAIAAKVGQTITFTNGDSVPHTATLDDGSCTTPQIAGRKSDGLSFTAAGTYPFHCSVHPTMKGTITIG